MSELRQQLERAKQLHQVAGYPGDLATDVLPELRLRPPLRRRILWIGGVTGAIAAAIALMILLHRPQTTTTPPTASVFVRHTPPAMPEMPSDLPIVPPYQSLTSIPAMPASAAKPGFPSLKIDL